MDPAIVVPVLAEATLPASLDSDAVPEVAVTVERGSCMSVASSIPVSVALI